MGQPVSDNTLTSYIESSRYTMSAYIYLTQYTLTSYIYLTQYTKTTRGTETSKYPEEKKAKAIPPVAASEKGAAQTDSSESG